jgi:uncharacterized membrane-anchored protein
MSAEHTLPTSSNLVLTALGPTVIGLAIGAVA